MTHEKPPEDERRGELVILADRAATVGATFVVAPGTAAHEAARLQAAIEALLLATGEPLSEGALATLLEAPKR